ncbi:MAG: hypothetical protein ACO1OD_02460 [Croceibacterium sp.]
MGNIRKHTLSNLSGLGALLSLCVEEWLAGYLGKGWQTVSWGWLAVALAALWLGAQISQFESNQHPLQDWLRRHKEKVRFGDAEPNYSLGQVGRYKFCADVSFTAHLSNVVIKVETFREFSRPSGPEWARIGRRNALERLECSAGQSETVDLIRVDRKPAEPDPPKNALADYARAAAAAIAPRPDVTEGFYRVVVTVTAAGIEPHSREFDFEWRNNQLRPLPLTPDAADFGSPTLGQDDGVGTLWIRT